MEDDLIWLVNWQSKTSLATLQLELSLAQLSPILFFFNFFEVFPKLKTSMVTTYWGLEIFQLMWCFKLYPRPILDDKITYCYSSGENITASWNLGYHSHVYKGCWRRRPVVFHIFSFLYLGSRASDLSSVYPPQLGVLWRLGTRILKIRCSRARRENIKHRVFITPCIYNIFAN